VERVRTDAATGALTAGNVTLDGINSRITAGNVVIYGNTSQLTAGNVTLDGSASTVTATASSGAKVQMIAEKAIGPYQESVVEWTPPSYGGVTWIPGQIRSAYTGSPGAASMSVASPRTVGANNGALIALIGGYPGHDSAELQMYGEDTFVDADRLWLEGKTGANTAVDVSGTLYVSGSATAGSLHTNTVETGTIVTHNQNGIATGSSNLSMNGSGDANVGAAIASATGWSTIAGAVVWNGDATTRANIVMGKSSGAGSYGTSWNVRVWLASTGAVVTSNARFDWIAFGR